MEQFGYVEPVIWNKATGRVVGGHQRLKVLMDMGVTEVECVVVEMDEEGKSPQHRPQQNLRRLGQGQADASSPTCRALIFDVSLTGFDPAEIDDLFKDSLKDEGQG